MSDYHQHRAVQVVLVPIPALMPMEIGSNKVLREVKPPSYPSDRREAWRPARAIPGRRGKAERLKNFLDRWAKQDADIRAFMQPDPAAMRAWLSRGGVLV